MFTKIEPHLYLGDESDLKFIYSFRTNKPYLYVDARPFFNILHADPNAEELMVEPLRALSAALAMLVSNYVDVYIYCQAGIERSPFLTALVLFQLGRGTIEECYHQVVIKRPETLVYQAWVDAYSFHVRKEG